MPVVATDVGELARIVREHDLGELYRPGDSADLVRAIERAVARYPELQANVRVAAGPLSWDTDSHALVDAYASLQTDRSQVGILSRHQTKPKEGS